MAKALENKIMDIKEKIRNEIWDNERLCDKIIIRQDIFFDIVNTTSYLNDSQKLKLILNPTEYYFGVPLTIDYEIVTKEYELKY